MTLALLALLVGAEPPVVPLATPDGLPPIVEVPALEALEPQPEPVKYDPGWARKGSVIGFMLSGVPVVLAVGSAIATYTRDGTARDVMAISAGVSGPLIAIIPTQGGRSAVLDADLSRRPTMFRIVGWVLVIYGAVSLAGGTLLGIASRYIAEQVGFGQGLTTGTLGDVLTAIGTATTLLDGALATAGLMFLASSAKTSAERAEARLVPSVAVVPSPGGGVAVMAGLSGRM